MASNRLLDRLARFELALAHFNACRTSAIASEVDKLHTTLLSELPDCIAAVEIRPAEVQPQIVNQLLSTGFRPGSSLCYLSALTPAKPMDVQLQVTRLDRTQTDPFFDLLESSGVPFPSERRAAKQNFYCTEQFQAFVATDVKGSVMGWGMMFLNEDSAFLGNSFTHPEMRGRGAHAALLAARLNAAAAAAAGVADIFTDVEHGSQSHANCERAGFRTITINTIWERST